MKIETYIDSLVAYAMNTGLAEPEDHQVLTNRLLDLLGKADYEPSDEPMTEDLEEILTGILAYAVGNGLCDDRCQCSPLNACAKPCNEDNIEHNIDRTGNNEEVQRGARITDGAHEPCLYIVEHAGGYAGKDDVNIQKRILKNIFGRVHQDEHSAGRKHHDRRDDGCDGDAEPDDVGDTSPH